MKLYHYTCSHRIRQIHREGQLQPHPQIALANWPLIWLTDMDVPSREWLGLTSETLRCDRTEWRITVDADAEPWVKFARGLSLPMRRRLELADGARPMHWWISSISIPVLSIKAVSHAAA